MEKQDFFSDLKNKCPSDEEIERTMEIIKLFNIKIGEELTQLYLESDVLFFTCVSEKFLKVSIHQFDINPLYCVSLNGHTWEGGVGFTGLKYKPFKTKVFLTSENIIRGGISSVMGDRYVKSDENTKILF